MKLFCPYIGTCKVYSNDHADPPAGLEVIELSKKGYDCSAFERARASEIKTGEQCSHIQMLNTLEEIRRQTEGGRK